MATHVAPKRILRIYPMGLAYTISCDIELSLVTITFEPTFWDDEVKKRFVAETLLAIASLGCEIGKQLILVDLRNAILQSQSTIATLQKFLSDPRGGKVALVAESPLSRMQTKRLRVREDVRMFNTVSEASAWLM